VARENSEMAGLVSNSRGPVAPFGFGIKKGNGERTKQIVNDVDVKPARINRRYKLKPPVVKSFVQKGDPCLGHWDAVMECFELYNFQRSFCVEPMTFYHECHQYYGVF
jgi:hypothetical protein